MRQPKHILARVVKVKIPLSFLTLSAFVLTHLMPQVSVARNTPAYVLKNPAMVMTMMAVAKLNHSMRVAAENPQDEWRVQNVRHAMGMIPVALMGLAAEFKADKLVDSDLPTAMSALGGFVDKNAADGYKKFLQKPSAAYIPRLGDNFPQSYVAKAEKEASASVSATDTSTGVTGIQDTAKSGSNLNTSSDLKQFKGDDLVDLNSFVAQKKMNIDSSVTTQSVSASDSVSPSVSAGNRSSEKGFVESRKSDEKSGRELASTQGNSGFVPQLLVTDELNSKNPKDKSLDKSSKSKDEEDEEAFFKKDAKSKEKALKAKRNRKKLREGVSFLPSSVRFFPVIALLNEFVFTNAFAEPSGEPPAPCGKKPQCNGGGSGGNEDAQGGASGEILMGLAAIMGAVAPIVAVSIQSKADKEIAQITANSQKELTQISAANSKYLSDQQKEITLTQTKVAQDVAQKNNEFATDRLDRQLAELRNQRDQNYALEKEKRAIDNDYNNKRIDLAVKQAEAQEKLNKEALQADIAKAGFSQGFGSSNALPGSQKLAMTPATVTPTPKPSPIPTFSNGNRAGLIAGATRTSSQGSFSGPSLANSLGGTKSSLPVGNNSLPGNPSVGSNANAAGFSSTAFSKGTARGIASLSSATGTPQQKALVSGIPSLQSGVVLKGAGESVNALKGEVQRVNIRSIALYQRILQRRSLTGTNRFHILRAKQTGRALAISSPHLAYLASMGSNSGTVRTKPEVANKVRGYSRPLNSEDVYYGGTTLDEESTGEPYDKHRVHRH